MFKVQNDKFELSINWFGHVRCNADLNTEFQNTLNEDWVLNNRASVRM